MPIHAARRFVSALLRETSPQETRARGIHQTRTVSDAALLTRPKTDRAFERLYRRHVHDVYRYVLAVLRNPADAEDVTQATFLNAFRAFQRGDRPELARNWLLKIAHNECRQRFRTLSRRPKEVVWDERAAAPPIDEAVPTADEIRQALGHLSFNQRSALVMRELEGRSYGEIGEILDLSVSAVETLIFRARRALREQLEGGLSCGEAEATLSKRLDGTLAPSGQRALRAHLRECSECATLERKQRAQRAALKRLGVVQLPPSLAGFLGGGAGSTVGGIVAGSGIGAKAAAMVAAGVLAGGVGHQAVEAVAAREPNRTELPRLKEVPRAFPKVYAPTAAMRNSKQADPGTAVSFAPVDASAVRAAVGKALARPGAGASTSQPSAGTAGPSAGQPAASATAVTKNAAQPVSAVVETATTVVKEVTKAPLPTPPPSRSRRRRLLSRRCRRSRLRLLCRRPHRCHLRRRFRAQGAETRAPTRLGSLTASGPIVSANGNRQQKKRGPRLGDLAGREGGSEAEGEEVAAAGRQPPSGEGHGRGNACRGRGALWFLRRRRGDGDGDSESE